MSASLGVRAMPAFSLPRFFVRVLLVTGSIASGDESAMNPDWGYSSNDVEDEFCEVRLSHIERTSKAPRWPNLLTSSTIQRRPQEK